MEATPAKLGIVSLGVALALAACNSATPNPDPYANGAQYPWTDTGALGLAATAAVQTGYLSDQAWASASNGWGPVERNTSNGEYNAGDGRTITINGKTFAKGLGVHANGRIQYNLGGNCSRFTAMIGVDDEATDDKPSSVRFEVWSDAKNLYNSGRMTARDAAKAVAVDISGKGDLILHIYDDGDGNTWDHADWADAKVTCSTVTPPPPPPPPNTVYLSDLPLLNQVNGWGPIEKDMSNGEQAAGDGRTISLGGKKYAKGVGVHAVAGFEIQDFVAIRSKLNCTDVGSFLVFKTTVGMDDEVAGTDGAATFQFSSLYNGPYVFFSPVYQLSTKTAPQTIEYGIPSNFSTGMYFKIGQSGNNVYSAHVSLGDARFECATNPTVTLSADMTSLTGPGSVTFTATVSGDTRFVRSVQFYDTRGLPPGREPEFATDSSAPYTATVTSDGSFTESRAVAARVMTDGGKIMDSNIVNVDFKPTPWPGTRTVSYTRDQVSNLLLDATGAYYVVGKTLNTGLTDQLFVAKYDRVGTPVWTRTFGDRPPTGTTSCVSGAAVESAVSSATGDISVIWSKGISGLGCDPIPGIPDFKGAFVTRIRTDSTITATATLTTVLTNFNNPLALADDGALAVVGREFAGKMSPAIQRVYLVTPDNQVSTIAAITASGNIGLGIAFGTGAGSPLAVTRGKLVSSSPVVYANTFERWTRSGVKIVEWVFDTSNTFVFQAINNGQNGLYVSLTDSPPTTAVLYNVNFDGTVLARTTLGFPLAYLFFDPTGSPNNVLVGEYRGTTGLFLTRYAANGASLGAVPIPLANPDLWGIFPDGSFVVMKLGATQSQVDKYAPDGTKL